MTILKALRSRGRRRGRSSSATPSAAGLNVGVAKIHRASTSTSRPMSQSRRSDVKQPKPLKQSLNSGRVKTSASGVKRSRKATIGRVRGHHKLAVRNKTLGFQPSTGKCGHRPTSSSGRPKLRRAPPFTRLSSLPAPSHQYFLRSLTKTVPRSPERRRIAFACDVVRYSLRSLTGREHKQSWYSSASDTLVVSRPPGTRARNIGLSNRDSHRREDGTHVAGKKRKLLSQPPPPPNTPCSSPETPATPPRKRTRSSPVLREKSTGGNPRPRTTPAALSGTKRGRSGHVEQKEPSPSAKRRRRHDDILMDLTSRLDAIGAASGNYERVVIPTVKIRRQCARRTSTNAVSISINAVVRKLKRQLAKATPTICDMILRNGKIKLSQI